MNKLREALRQIVNRYDAYRRRGVSPAPTEYADVVEAIESARAALAEPAQQEPPQGFVSYFEANYNGEVVFTVPKWHAERIWRAAMYFSDKPHPPTAQPAAQQEPVALTLVIREALCWGADNYFSDENWDAKVSEFVAKVAAQPAAQPVARKAHGAIISALASIVNTRQTDEQLDADVIPRDPVMGEVVRIRAAADILGKIAITAKDAP